MTMSTECLKISETISTTSMPRAFFRRIVIVVSCTLILSLLVTTVLFSGLGFSLDLSQFLLDSQSSAVLSQRLFRSIKYQTNRTYESEVDNKKLAWFFRNGSLAPAVLTGNRTVNLFPEEAPGKDRITDQLMFLPFANSYDKDDSEVPLKKILLWSGSTSWNGVPLGED